MDLIKETESNRSSLAGILSLRGILWDIDSQTCLICIEGLQWAEKEAVLTNSCSIETNICWSLMEIMINFLEHLIFNYFMIREIENLLACMVRALSF